MSEHSGRVQTTADGAFERGWDAAEDRAGRTITLLQDALNEAAQALYEGDDRGTRSESIADRIRAIQRERDHLRGAVSADDAPTAVRWNALDPNDEHTALIVPAEDLRALEAWAAAAAQRLRGAVEPTATRSWTVECPWCDDGDYIDPRGHRHRCAHCEGTNRVEVVSLSQLRGAVTPSDIVTWLRGRTGAHGGGFTSADDVADAIEREFTDAR